MNIHTVCFPMPRFEMGGLERVQMHIASGLVTAGFQVELLTKQINTQAQVLIRPDVPVRVLAGGRLHYLYRLVCRINKTKPNIIITSANDVGCLILLLRRFFYPETRVVWTQHLSLSGPLQISKGPHWLRLWFEIFLMRRLVNKADAVVAVSKAVATDMQHLLHLDVQVIYNPVISNNTEQISSEFIHWPWLNHDLPTIVFVGRLTQVKRLDLLIQAFAICNKTIPARLLIVGDGVESNSVKALAKSLKLEKSCQLVGHQDNPLPWIRKSDLLVLCSDVEGFGLVLVEAMACGTQVLSTDCPDGPAEILANGKYGRLVPTDNINALALAMKDSLQLPLVSEKVLKARAAEFSVDRAITQYVNLLETVLSN